MGDLIQYDLLFGGGYSIKDYYMESGNPRQMRGASELLNMCAAEVQELLKTKYNVLPCYDVFTGGATLCARVRRQNGEDFHEKKRRLVKEAEDVFRLNCRTASAAFVLVEMGQCYKAASRLAHAEFDNRREANFTSWKFQNAKASGWIKSKNCQSLESACQKDNGIKKMIPARCPRCRLRDPRYLYTHDNGEKQFLCESCARREYVSCDRQRELQRELQRERQYNLRIKCGDHFDYSHEIDTMSKLMDNKGRVALLYADVNNLGGQPLKKTFEEDKCFHKAVNDAVTEAVHDAIQKAMGYDKAQEGKKITAKFEIISLAGDDICLLLPGDAALQTAMTLVDVFDKNNGHDLTISVAACVANDTTPLTYMERIVDKAMNDAKIDAYSTGESVINLAFFEQPSDLFPMTATRMAVFHNLLAKASSIPATTLHNISEARRELVFNDEFNKEFADVYNLFFRYHLSRDVHAIRESKKALEQIKQEYEGKNPWPDFIAWRGQNLGGGNY